VRLICELNDALVLRCLSSNIAISVRWSRWEKAGSVGSLIGVIGSQIFVRGLIARLMYVSLYRLHVATLHDWVRMVLDTLAHRLRRSTEPRVKLH
jgi:hypothetical protein